MNPSKDHAAQVRQSVDLLWHHGRGNRRGPKPRLNPARIAHAAIAVADAEGLGAVSMQRVASELGYTTMSLYNHVPSKELLLELMLDIAAAPETDPPPADHWRDAVLAWAASVWSFYMAHPWSLQIYSGHAPVGPGNLTRLEHLLTALQPSGLRPAKTMSVSMNLLTMLRGMAQLALDVPPKEDAVHYDAAMADLADLRRFPRLAEVIADEQAAPRGEHYLGLPPDTYFGISRLLDGIEDYVDTQG